jgi:ferrous iron transport protein B
VEVTRALAPGLSGHPTIIDTPGTNSLTPLSEDERVTRDVLLDSPGSHVIQVGDAKNLRRALLLSIELAELEVPFSLVLNMRDEADAAGIVVDAHRL